MSMPTKSHFPIRDVFINKLLHILETDFKIVLMCFPFAIYVKPCLKGILDTMEFYHKENQAYYLLNVLPIEITTRKTNTLSFEGILKLLYKDHIKILLNVLCSV